MKTANSNNKTRDELAVSNLILEINKLLLSYFGRPTRNSKSNPLDILIATILSQNTNDINSHKAFLELKNRFKNYEELINSKNNVLQKTIKVAGLAKQKSTTIKNFLLGLKKQRGKISLKFLNKYSNLDAINYLTSFKGVGVKTAACVLLFGMNRNVCPVDTHVFRVLNRIGIVNENNRDKTFFKLLEILPQNIAHEFHTNIIKLGRTICKSQKPNCASCPVIKFCSYDNKNLERSNNNSMNKKSDFMLLDNV